MAELSQRDFPEPEDRRADEAAAAADLRLLAIDEHLRAVAEAALDPAGPKLLVRAEASERIERRATSALVKLGTPKARLLLQGWGIQDPHGALDSEASDGLKAIILERAVSCRVNSELRNRKGGREIG